MTTVVADEAVLRRLLREELHRAIQPVMDALGQHGAGQAAGRDDTFMTAEEVAELLRIDRRTLRRLELEGDMPRPIVIADRTKRWRRCVIEKWLHNLEQRP